MPLQTLFPLGYLGSYIARIKTTSPIAYWPLNEASGTVAFDRSGNGLNGTYANVTLGQSGIGDGRTSALFNGTTSKLTIQQAGLTSRFSGAEGSILVWAKVLNANVWTDATARYLVRLRADGSNDNQLYKSSANYNIGIKNVSGNTTRDDSKGAQADLGWVSWILTWSVSNGRVRAYKNGYQYAADLGAPGTWAGNLSISMIGAGNTTPASVWNGYIAHTAIWNRELTVQEALGIGRLVRYTDQTFFTFGDSKTNSGGWQPILSLQISAATGNNWVESTPKFATDGGTVATRAASIQADLALTRRNPYAPQHVLCNLGANDVGSLPAEATWKANYLTCVDALNNRWPSAKIYITKPWRRNYSAECNTLAGWIDAIVATRAFLYAGDDERTWLEGGDDGVTMTTDGVHYSSAGNTEKANQMKTITGY